MSEQHLTVGMRVRCVSHNPAHLGTIVGLTANNTAYEHMVRWDGETSALAYPAEELTRADAPLTVADYQAAALRTANHQLTGDKALIIAALGLTGEAGEVADLVKKHIGQGHPYDAAMRDALIDEAGDIAWYLASLCAALMVPMEDVLRRNIEKLRGRYPDGFSSERSQHREPVTVKGE